MGEQKAAGVETMRFPSPSFLSRLFGDTPIEASGPNPV